MITIKGKLKPYMCVAPTHQKLPWPGLKAHDRLSRVVTRAVKDAKEMRETETWAKQQIARVLDHLPPDAMIPIVCEEMRRRGEPVCVFLELLI
jgi:hypothetical protein